MNHIQPQRNQKPYLKLKVKSWLLVFLKRQVTPCSRFRKSNKQDSKQGSRKRCLAQHGIVSSFGSLNATPLGWLKVTLSESPFVLFLTRTKSGIKEELHSPTYHLSEMKLEVVQNQVGPSLK